VKRLWHPTHSEVEAQDNRLVAWTAGLGMIRTHPLAGIGLGNFKTLLCLFTQALK